MKKVSRFQKKKTKKNETEDLKKRLHQPDEVIQWFMKNSTLRKMIN